MLSLVLCVLLSTALAQSELSDDWVVEVEGGLEEASRLAALTETDLLGEVLPGSQLYHLRQRKRLRREAGEDLSLERLLQEDSLVRSFNHQAVLKRVKRDGEEKCFVSTLESPDSPSRRCIFPFQYKGVLYQRCTSDHSSNGAQWCATSLTRAGEVVTGEWGDCDFSNVQCQILEAVPARPPPPPPQIPPPLRLPVAPPGTRKLPATLDEFLFLLGPRRPPPRPIVEESRQQQQQQQQQQEEEDSQDTNSVERFSDSEWPRQWYLNRGGDLDMNVEAAWDLGYSGKGVTVTILDDGVEWNHPDLAANYKEEASFDINANDKDPFPRYDLFDTNKHGTRCAGQVSAQANNSVCSVGIAFNSGIGGVRMLDGTITDAVEARSLSLNPQSVDIYSASWGPDDDGQTVDGPGPLTRRAIEEGVKGGRGGLGSIYVWASGNGGKFEDNCNCDGYATSIFTVSVSSASENGNIPWYSEQCSSTLASTYSSGSSRQGERKVITTDLHGRCTSSHTGTSASSPMAAGMIALLLEAKPSLSWRDVQHIIVRTAKRANLKADDWASNGAGYNVSHAFGFGLMDAGAMVVLAQQWQTVGDQQRCQTEWEGLEVSLGGREKTKLSLEVEECGEKVAVMEHVHVTVDISSNTRRGLFSLELESPSGTVSRLLANRPLDNSLSGFANFRTWPLMSTHYWGESPVGTWKLLVNNGGDRTAYIGGWRLIVYGSSSVHNTELM